ncbi:uncharacterized protein LOC131146236 isoform X1 [Malania oleifera]|uniref:uncharacterized protein LOC131146236 isoform X1 n=1 Tax=Malania oleifera TaxID=397392 RepID=UPI0025AE04DF|nr:uncharacterized protein LOC131146236 isoform X1 [Malania oleifera]
MRPSREPRRRSRSSPRRDRPADTTGFEPRPSGTRSPRLAASSSFLDTFVSEDFPALEDLHISNTKTIPSPNANPRSFPYSVKQQCWEKAEKIKGRDPDRWRLDALGNIVFRKLVGCSGCLCHDFDHIIPYSKGGKSTLDNCQVLQGCAARRLDLFWLVYQASQSISVTSANLAHCNLSGQSPYLISSNRPPQLNSLRRLQSLLVWLDGIHILFE